MTDPLELFRQRLGHSVRHLVAGDPQDSAELIAEDAGDPGLFGPGSAVWTVHSDAAMLIGGVHALLMQTLHPLAMAGVAEHSDYKSDPLGRLQRTAQFVGITTFGSTEQAVQATEMVRSIHNRVQGTAPNGETYSANDPRLLAWIHATEVDSFLRSNQRYGKTRLTSDEADRYVAEMGQVGVMLGMDGAPQTVAQLDREIEGFRGELASTRQSREALRWLTFPPLPLPVRGAYGIMFGAAIGLLPRWARRMMAIPTIPLADKLTVRPVASALTSTLSWALGPSPSLEAAEARTSAG